MTRFTQAEIAALITAINFLASGEWSETITEEEHAALLSAEAKLRKRQPTKGPKQ
jgi:hypothetical protein